MEKVSSGGNAALDLAARFGATYQPKPAVILLAGSRARGTATSKSDYDLVFLYEELSEGAWREMAEFEGSTVEVFAHDLRTIAYFFYEIERPSGEPALARMIHEGLAVVEADHDLARRAKALAEEFLQSGPAPLDGAALSQRRYGITDLAEALPTATSDQRMAIASSLYLSLTNFVLRANGSWAAGGKALPSALQELGCDLAQEITGAFETLYRTGQDTAVQRLVDSVLQPFGGRLRAGFRQQAPASWR